MSPPLSPEPPAAEPPLRAPVDRPFPGVIGLEVDARDIARRIIRVRETIPAAAGPMTLLFPEWLPGYHAPQAPIELLAGLRIRHAGGEIRWRRHAVNVHAFQFDVPAGVDSIEAEFQFLSPTAPGQGREVIGAELLMLQWNTVVLYPAGFFARRIEIAPTLLLPDEWEVGCALDVLARHDASTHFAPTPLDVLIDSPVLAGRNLRRIALDDAEEVHLVVAADRPDLLAISPDQLAPHRALIAEADLLFGPRPFDRYEILLALSDEIASIGVEHHRSCEAVTIPTYFTEWEDTFARRDTIPHEYIHSWNGKHRRGADSWTPSFDQPIRNGMLWVYEGQTQYWDRVLCARSGLWTPDDALAALALTAATHEARAGSRWRPMSDTTRDPIIAARGALPWPSWQRSEDYYSEGALVWLDVDTRIRELSGETRSLDDFARAFFGATQPGRAETSTYTFSDVVAGLEALAPFDWRGFFTAKVEGRHDGAPLAGIARGGYRLVYREQPTAYWANVEALEGTADLTFSIGLAVSADGSVQSVLWDGPAFQAGLTAGTTLLQVHGGDFSLDLLREAIAGRAPLDLRVRRGRREHAIVIPYAAGHRYPHLEPALPGPRRLDAILRPRRAGGAD